MTDISLQPFLHVAIGRGHPLVLPQMLGSGTYDKGLDESVERFPVAIDTPGRRPVPAPGTPVATNCLQKFVDISRATSYSTVTNTGPIHSHREEYRHQCRAKANGSKLSVHSGIGKAKNNAGDRVAMWFSRRPIQVQHASPNARPPGPKPRLRQPQRLAPRALKRTARRRGPSRELDSGSADQRNPCWIPGASSSGRVV